jgi:DNA-binding MarR family transcriptional regulator
MARSDPAQCFTALVNEIFVCNGHLLAAGDELSRPYGLTAAQWQILGRLARGPATVSSVARNRGLRRQSVQETMNLLSSERLVERHANPRDKRSPLWSLAAPTRDLLKKLEKDRSVWAKEMAGLFGLEDVQRLSSLLASLTAQLESRESE